MPYSHDIFYRIYNEGEGPQNSYPLVLLHGSGGSHMAWPVDIRRSISRRVIALDLPGHGKSIGSACQRLPGLVQSLRRFLDDLHVYHADLAGHSLGALLALEFTQAFPRRVRSLFLLACGSRFNVPPELFDSLLCPNRGNRFSEDFSRIAFSRYFPESQRRKLLAPLNQVRSSTLLADLSICAEYRLNGNFREIACPTQLVNGSDDLITTPASARELLHNLPHAELEVLPKCGHLLLYEKTALITKMMRGFFDSK
jgi:pimeloyl-ACP methyl ester carboxylesterase